MYLLLPMLLIIFSVLEYRIERFREELGFIKKSRMIKLVSEIIIFIGFTLLILSPLFKTLLELLALPITLIIFGTFVFLVSKFYDISKK